MTEAEYNPLDYENLTRNVVQELMQRGPYPLPPTERFTGAGVYALFYTGNFKPYGPVRSPHASMPIYVGKAVPKGTRTGGGPTPKRAGTPLFERLKHHARSIKETTNVEIADFRCRYLVVTPLWITMAEQLLIREFRPLWNSCIDGFGIHDPGSGRHAGEVSWWDALHPGRLFATRLKQTRTEREALDRLDECLKGHLVLHDLGMEMDTRSAEAAATLEGDASE